MKRKEEINRKEESPRRLNVEVLQASVKAGQGYMPRRLPMKESRG